jgi:hypothetical protein
MIEANVSSDGLRDRFEIVNDSYERVVIESVHT